MLNSLPLWFRQQPSLAFVAHLCDRERVELGLKFQSLGKICEHFIHLFCLSVWLERGGEEIGHYGS